ncbi:hypothetical protein D4R71_00420 [bacterium]|nr:MAG: hypothetical protein D4R71_00420 [bacterium]
MMDMEFDFLCDTLLHISEVRENLEIISSQLKQRGYAHDKTKLQQLEFDGFVSTREKFKKANYGSPEYQECIELTKPAVEHHYKNNRHHTGFHKNGINDMTLIDIIEMIADWRAAARRSPDKKLENTLDYATKKYGIQSQLAKVIINTFEQLNWITPNRIATEKIAGALFDFCGHLTTLGTPIEVGSFYDAGLVLRELEKWAKIRKFNLDNADVKNWNVSL